MITKGIFGFCMLEVVDKELDIAGRLGQLMREKEFTQSSLSRASGVPQPTINRILVRVTRDPRRESVVKLANCFNVSPEFLYGSVGAEEPGQPKVEVGKTSVEKYSLNMMESVESIYKQVELLNPKQREKLANKIIMNLL